MKAESDSESADEIDLKVEIVEKNILIKTLETRVKGQGLAWKHQADDAMKNLETMQSRYDFSTRANISLKEDYDLLQDKLDKYMKSANVQLSERNE